MVKENPMLNLWALAAGSRARNSKELSPVLVSAKGASLAHPDSEGLRAFAAVLHASESEMMVY